uniref:Anaphase-promoting complex subunit 1 n=1 Tax=Parascaris univalens TaxID=6257 RepID=A0A915BVM4_PARUN
GGTYWMHERGVDQKRSMIVSESIRPLDSHVVEASKLRYRTLEDGSGEMLEIADDDTVTVTSLPGGVLLYRVTADFRLLDAFWCDFPTTATGGDFFDNCICLIGSQVIQFCPRNGCQIYAVTLPFSVSKVLQSPYGLILEKDHPPRSKRFDTLFPHLFSLSHPYNEVLPVVCRSKDDQKSCHYVSDALELEALNTLKGSRLLLCYSSRSCAHSLYFMRTVTKEEWKYAASKAESLVSRSTRGTPAEASVGQSPLCPSFLVTPRNRPRIDRQEPAHIVCTRSMTAAATFIHSLPFSPTGRIIHSRSFRDAALFRSRGTTFEASPRLASLYEQRGIVSAIDMRGSELELIAPEMCIESIWTEPRRRNADDMPSRMPATISFFTTDLIGQNYACFYSSEWEILKCVRVISHDDGSFTAARTYTAIKCISATNIEGRRMMAVVEMDRSTVLYTGIYRLGTLYAQYGTIERSMFPSNSNQSPHTQESACGITVCAPVDSVWPFRQGHFLLQEKDSSYSICSVPPSTSCDFVKECLDRICSLLPNDKSLRFASSWVLENSWRLTCRCRDNRLALEVALFIQFVFSRCGILIHDFVHFREIERIKVQCASSAADPKKKRTIPGDRSSAWEYLLSMQYVDAGELGMSTHRYTVDLSDEAELHSHALFMISGLHAGYEHAKMDTRLSFITPMMASSLHALSVVFDLPAYVNYYREDFPWLMEETFNVRGGVNKESLWGVHRFSERVPSFHGSVLRLIQEHGSLGSFSCPAKCLPVVVIIAVGLQKIRSSVDLQKAIGKNWNKKLELCDADAAVLTNILDSEESSVAYKCRRCACLFNVDEHYMVHLPPSISLLVCELLYDDHMLALNFFAPAPEMKPYRALPSEEDIQETVRRRWKDDGRFANATQMLDSSRPIFVPVVVGVPELEQREAQEQLLTMLNLRALAQCFGRAALDFRHCVPAMNAPLSVPTLCFQGRTHPANTPFEMQQTEVAKAIIEWGAYYNGLATALRIGGERSCKLDGEWLALSASEQKDSASAGMMYGFGLNGHIAKMNLFTIHELLSAGDRLMSVSVLLGYAANMVATGDRQIHKMLVTHLPFMMGPTLLELHIDPIVQTAALVGLGLLFAKSSNLGILTVLLNEMGKPAPVDQEPWTDRYSYTLAVGFAIGLISLVTSVVDDGGWTTVSLCLSNELTNRCFAAWRMRDSESPYLSNIQSCGPATVALGLMYLRTGNKMVAKRMRAPETLSNLEKVRPDHLLLRTLCQSLILWDQIEPTRAYVEELVPPVVRQYVSRFFDEEALLVDEDTAYLSTIMDLETIARSYLYIVAGACFAIAIRFASSCCSEAFRTIMHYLSIVFIEWGPTDRSLRLCHTAGSTVCSSVLNQLLYSVALVMAGSGDLEVLRMCRVLRRRVTEHSTHKDATVYSTQVAVSTAIGFLMMGKGRYAFATNDLSIAALVISLFPVAPHSVSDNRTYLQPLRFLWSLAAEERLVEVVDAETDEALDQATLAIRFKQSKLKDATLGFMHSPLILPELSNISEITFTCDNYESRVFHLQKPADLREIETVLRARHGSLPLTRIGRVKAKITQSRESHKDIDIGDDDLKNCNIGEMLLDAEEIDEEEIVKEVEEEKGASSGTMVEGAQSSEERGEQKWGPSYTDEVDRVIEMFSAVFGTSDAHGFLRQFMKDMVENDATRFPRVQFDEVKSFLERCERKRFEPTAISSELVDSVRNLR